MTELNPMQLNVLMQSTILNNCLTNCSGNGACNLRNGSLVCECVQFHAGIACQNDIRPCSSAPCINNGTCSDNIAEQTYTCDCDLKLFFGVNCESLINLCANVTCSDSGFCKVAANNEPVCKCFPLFSGTNCEIKSAVMRAIENCITTASIIAIICICAVYVFMAFLDFS
jgi:hypothetical protein